MIWSELLWPGAAGIVAGAALVARAASVRADCEGRDKTTSGRLEPARPGTLISQAPVYGVDLLIRFREAGGALAETIITPKSIVGPRVKHGGVRPEAINAFCRTQRAMRTFRYDDIIWAADAFSGDLIDDLYHYLGGAQPGGAPALPYAADSKA